MSFTAKDVAELRRMTGAGMMKCKEALTESNGDVEEAKNWLRKKGLQTADKKAGRETKAGLIGTYTYYNEGGNACGEILEIKCETDFVAKNPTFQEFMVDSLKDGLKLERIPVMVNKIGENIQYGKMAHIEGGLVIGSYVHNSFYNHNTIDMGTIGVLVSMNGIVGDEIDSLAHKVAMHIAASSPKAVDETDLDEEFIATEKRILVEQALESGKPESIVEKMVAGRLNKVLKEVCLVNQPFVMDPNKTVGQLLEESKASVVSFIRFQIGE